MFGVASQCQVADEVEPGGVATEADDPLDNFVDADIFSYDGLNIGKERMFWVGTEDLTRAFGLGFEQAGLFEFVKFEADGVSRFIEFSSQATEVTRVGSVEEELQQEFEFCFRSYEGF